MSKGDETAKAVEAWLNGKSAELRERMTRVGNGDTEALRIVAAVSAQEEHEPGPIETEDRATLAALRRINRREKEGR